MVAPMILCSCNVLSDGKIKAAILSPDGPRTPSAVYRCLGCRPNCGRCFVTVKAMIRDFIVSEGLSEVSDPPQPYELRMDCQQGKPEACC